MMYIILVSFNGNCHFFLCLNTFEKLEFLFGRVIAPCRNNLAWALSKRQNIPARKACEYLPYIELVYICHYHKSLSVLLDKDQYPWVLHWHIVVNKGVSVPNGWCSLYDMRCIHFAVYFVYVVCVAVIHVWFNLFIYRSGYLFILILSNI